MSHHQELLGPFFGDWDTGGQNVMNARGGELYPKVVTGKLGLLTPKSRIRNSGAAEKIRNFNPASNSEPLFGKGM